MATKLAKSNLDIVAWSAFYHNFSFFVGKQLKGVANITHQPFILTEARG
jgi:hypothetical protein